MVDIKNAAGLAAVGAGAAAVWFFFQDRFADTLEEDIEQLSDHIDEEFDEDLTDDELRQHRANAQIIAQTNYQFLSNDLKDEIPPPDVMLDDIDDEAESLEEQTMAYKMYATSISEVVYRERVDEDGFLMSLVPWLGGAAIAFASIAALGLGANAFVSTQRLIDRIGPDDTRDALSQNPYVAALDPDHFETTQPVTVPVTPAPPDDPVIGETTGAEVIDALPDGVVDTVLSAVNFTASSVITVRESTLDLVADITGLSREGAAALSIATLVAIVIAALAAIYLGSSAAGVTIGGATAAAGVLVAMAWLLGIEFIDLDDLFDFEDDAEEAVNIA